MQISDYHGVFSLPGAAALLGRKAAENRTVLLSSFLFGFLAHGFTFTNKLLNHDEVYALFAKGTTVGLGRFGLGLMDLIFPNYSMPWIYGIICVALLAVSAVLLVNLFEIRGKLSQILFSGILLTFPSLTGTFGYMFASSSYALSFLLACAGVWLFTGKGLWKKGLALCLMIASLSIYQSYISLAAGLFVLYLFRGLLLGEKPGKILIQGIADVAFLVLSLGLYFIAAKLVMIITGVSFGEYATNSMDFRLSDLPGKVMLAYASFGRFFTESLHGLIPTSFSRLLHGLLAVLCLGLFLPWALSPKKEALGSLLLALFLLLILPLAINCMYLVSSEHAVHTLVLYGFVCLYLLPLILADTLHTQSRALLFAAENVLPLILAGIVAVNVYISNQAYLNLYLRYQNAHAFYSSLVADLNSNPDFQEGTKLALVGTYVSPAFYEEQFSDTDRITGVHGFLPDGYARAQFMSYYIGLDIPFASDGEVAALQELAQVQAMPRYPFYGSIQTIDGMLVVKLS